MSACKPPLHLFVDYVIIHGLKIFLKEIGHFNYFTTIGGESQTTHVVENILVLSTDIHVIVQIEH
jgi:hypothetical protein